MNRDRVFMTAVKSGCDVNDLFKALHSLSLQSHCFMVARNLMRIIINNEISLIIIFRYCYNNIDIFDVSQKYQYFFQKNNNIFDKNNNIFNIF